MNSQPLSEIFGIDFDVSQNLSHQPRANIFASVNGDCRAATIGVLELPMTPLRLAEKLEAHLFQGADQFSRLDVWQVVGTHTLTST